MTVKYRQSQSVKEQLAQKNAKLQKDLKRANERIVEVKGKYKAKVSVKCYYCDKELQLTSSSNLNTEQNDDVNPENEKPMKTLPPMEDFV